MVTEIWSNEIIELRNKRTKSPGFFADPKKRSPVTSTYELSPQGERSISAKIYPNGEFGVGYVRKKKISAQDRRYEADRRYAEENAEIVPTADFSDSGEWISYGRKIIPGTPPPKLGIGAESSQVSKRYGLKGITSYGRKMLRNAGHLIDKASEGQYNRLPQMGTVTVPAYHPETMKRICQNWGDIVRKFFQTLKRRYASFYKRFDYASCTEIQPQRWANRREVGLHLHFVYVAIRLGKNKWVLPDSYVRRVWGNTLASYLGGDEIPQLPNFRRDAVKQSSAAYLAKYASKGCDIVVEVAREAGEEFLPKQWWSMSSRLRAGIRRHTILSTGELAEKLLVISRWGTGDYIKYIRCITLQTNVNEYGKALGAPEEIILGYGGLLTYSGFRLFAPRNQDESIRQYLPRTLDKPKPLVTS